MNATKCINCGKPKKAEDPFCPTCETARKKLPPLQHDFLAHESDIMYVMKVKK